MAAQTCRNCKYLDQEDIKCHLHPPSIFIVVDERIEINGVHAVKITERIQSDFPIIKNPDGLQCWCGDFKQCQL